ncbi:hypothetical protein [Sphingomonas mucosissima]|uniref:Uncharacterized protein n=1 Tax=Sphingomonas mucosissima TaxID=370959 RepID=A0A245ZM31_9SPHN|nr:hypothetical protein [Sphingomonas mucosissima]OWK30800.1 hypothetical protein SPMU_17890 [Sphingomonas mucosissima]
MTNQERYFRPTCGHSEASLSYDMADVRQRALSVALFALALVIGTIVSVGERVVFAISLNRAVDLSEAGVIASNAVLTAFPFFYLAVRNSVRALPWLLGIMLTLAATGWWLSKGIAYQKAPDGSGVDMFGAMIMFLAPFAITAIVGFADTRKTRG